MSTTPFFTRKQRLDNECSHGEYYRSLYKDLGIDYSEHDQINRMREYVKNGDISLSTIPLRTWDVWGSWILGSTEAHAAFRKRGDSVSLSGIVCLLKVAALDAVRGIE